MLFCFIAAVLIACTSCSSNSTRHTDALESAVESRENGALLDTECESKLLYLAASIHALESDPTISQSTLVKLRELYSTSMELYLSRAYDLALTFIEEAVHLIEERSD